MVGSAFFRSPGAVICTAKRLRSGKGALKSNVAGTTLLFDLFAIVAVPSSEVPSSTCLGNFLLLRKCFQCAAPAHVFWPCKVERAVLSKNEYSLVLLGA